MSESQERRILEEGTHSQRKRHIPTITELWEAEAGGSHVQVQVGQFSDQERSMPCVWARPRGLHDDVSWRSVVTREAVFMSVERR